MHVLQWPDLSNILINLNQDIVSLWSRAAKNGPWSLYKVVVTENYLNNSDFDGIIMITLDTKSCFQVIWNNRSITPTTQKVLWNGGGGVCGLQPLVDEAASSLRSSVREIFPCESFFPIITSLVKKLSTPFVWSVPGCGELWWGRNYCMIILSPPIIRRENDMPPPLQLQRMIYVFPLEYIRKTAWVNDYFYFSKSYYEHIVHVFTEFMNCTIIIIQFWILWKGKKKKWQKNVTITQISLSYSFIILNEID